MFELKQSLAQERKSIIVHSSYTQNFLLLSISLNYIFIPLPFIANICIIPCLPPGLVVVLHACTMNAWCMRVWCMHACMVHTCMHGACVHAWCMCQCMVHACMHDACVHSVYMHAPCMHAPCMHALCMHASCMHVCGQSLIVHVCGMHTHE